jgi:hypothetical protein
VFGLIVHVRPPMVVGCKRPGWLRVPRFSMRDRQPVLWTLCPVKCVRKSRRLLNPATAFRSSAKPYNNLTANQSINARAIRIPTNNARSADGGSLNSSFASARCADLIFERSDRARSTAARRDLANSLSASSRLNLLVIE